MYEEKYLLRLLDYNFIDKAFDNLYVTYFVALIICMYVYLYIYNYMYGHRMKKTFFFYNRLYPDIYVYLTLNWFLTN